MSLLIEQLRFLSASCRFELSHLRQTPRPVLQQLSASLEPLASTFQTLSVLAGGGDRRGCCLIDIDLRLQRLLLHS